MTAETSGPVGTGGSAQDDLTAYGELLAARRALARDLLRDPVTMARGLDSTYVTRPHLRVIGAAMADVLHGVYDRLLILTPPQVGKSTTVAEWGPFWWLAHRPTDDIIIASYGADLAEDRSKTIKGLVAEHGHEYNLATQRGSTSTRDWRTTTGGHVRAVGVGGGLSGFPANLIIVDDPHKDRAEAESPRVRNAVHTWWSSTAGVRLQPDMGAVIAVHTRWHEDDFAGRRLKEEGRIEEGGRWKVVHLPAIADSKYGPDPIGRQHGEPLTHPKIPTRDVAALQAWWDSQKAGRMVRDWFSLYQGDPQPPSGALVTAELFTAIRETRLVSPPKRVGVSVDPSGGGRDAAGIIGGYLGEDDRLWITHDRSGVMSSTGWSREACLLAHETNAVVLFIEVNYGADMCTLAIKTAWQALQIESRIPKDALPPMIRTVKAKQGKLLRAEPIAQQMAMDRVRLRGFFHEFEHEWLTWQPTDTASPGRIDAGTYLGYGLLPIPTVGAQFAAPSATAQMPTTSSSPLAQGFGQGFGGSQLSPLG